MKHKIFRMVLSVEFFKELFSTGTEKTIVTDDAIPDDAVMIHQRFDSERRLIDFFFLSEKVGKEVQEGQSILDVIPTPTVFRTIETINKDKAKEIIDRLNKEGCQTGSGLSVYKLKKELGLK